jgi:hypothetical protein
LFVDWLLVDWLLVDWLIVDWLIVRRLVVCRLVDLLIVDWLIVRRLVVCCLIVCWLFVDCLFWCMHCLSVCDCVFVTHYACVSLTGMTGGVAVGVFHDISAVCMIV